MKQAYTEDEIASSMNWIWRAIRADLNEEQKNSIKTVLENPARKMKLIQFLVWAQFHEWEPDSIWLDVLREFMFRYDMIPPLFKEVHLSILSHDLREGLTNGVECEVCGQFCRVQTISQFEYDGFFEVSHKAQRRRQGGWRKGLDPS